MPDAKSMTMWQTAFNQAAPLPTDKAALANIFGAAGDSVLSRLHKHVGGDGGHLAEQLDRNTGVQMSASDLTWSVSHSLVLLAVSLN